MGAPPAGGAKLQAPAAWAPGPSSRAALEEAVPDELPLAVGEPAGSAGKTTHAKHNLRPDPDHGNERLRQRETDDEWRG